MATYTLSTVPSSGVRLIYGFVAGALAVVTFHQGAVAVLTSLGALSSDIYSMRPVAPLGVPQILSQAFWGGVWGIVFAETVPLLRRNATYWLAAVILGALVLPLAGWVVAPPPKGQPNGSGMGPAPPPFSV